MQKNEVIAPPSSLKEDGVSPLTLSQCESKALLAAAKKVATRLKEAGFIVYYVGGSVRDELLGKIPKDRDLATSATPEQILSLYPNAHTVGVHFGVVLIKEEGFYLEVATFRQDGDYEDGRHPTEVTYSSPEEDAQRRDFTLNGLFEDPFTGEIIDYVGGLADIKAHILRAIGEPRARFEEDALRLLRAVRFAVVTGFELEKETWAAMKEKAPLLALISCERIYSEFSRILLDPRRALGVRLLVESGLMHFIIPELYALKGCEQPPEWHPEGDVYTHTLLMLESLGECDSLALCYAVLLHDIGKPETQFFDEEAQRWRFNGHDTLGAVLSRKILGRLKAPNELTREVEEMVGNHMRFMHIQEMREAKVRRFMARSTFELEMELHRLDCLTSNGCLENYHFLEQKKEQYKATPLLPAPLLTGRDLIEAGFTPSPHFRVFLEELQTRQLEQDLTSREEALCFAHHFFSLLS